MRSALVIVLAAALVACGEPARGPADAEPAAATADALPAGTGIRFLAAGEGPARFALALEPRELVFPADHGAHPDFRNEWWYFTGNLQDAGGRHFGFELTFFRMALTASRPERASAWAAQQVWMGHFALTDTEAERFVADERMSRGALGLAGAMSDPFRVWVDDWSAAQSPASGAVRLSAATAEAAIDLTLDGFDYVVLQGDRGFDPKGPEAGNASYYYSMPRLRVAGSVRAGERSVAVTGLAWMDREWGTSALSPSLAGWDWFALQLDDGRDLMYYRLRGRDGATSPFSGGSIAERGGAVHRLAANDVALEPLDEWESPASGAVYPVAWRLRIPSAGLDLRVTPRLVNQEIRLSVRYWEGAVEAAPAVAGGVGGVGYLELAGY